jgi:hypothetical protein
MNRKTAQFAENIGESAFACILTMAQGNVLALTITHWVIASQTGILAGVVASVALMLAKTNKRWLVAVILGTATAAVDLFVHPGMFGSAATEAIVTGVGAAALSCIAGAIVHLWRARITRFMQRAL